MASLQSIKTDMKRYRDSRKHNRKIVIWVDGEPEPEHKPGDLLLRLADSPEDYI